MYFSYSRTRFAVCGAFCRLVTPCVLIVVLVCGTAQLAAAQPNLAGEFVAVGSTTIQPVVAHALASFIQGTQLEPQLIGGGSGAAAPAVRSGRADIGMMSRPVSSNELEGLVSVIIGYDALAIIVNSMNPLESVSHEEIRTIFTGRQSSWSGMPPWASEIVVVSKQVGRGTLKVFEAYSGLMSPSHSNISVEERELISADAWEAAGNLDSILWVGGVPAAVGYVSLSEADRFIERGHPIKKLVLEGVEPIARHVVDRSYPIQRELHLVYKSDNLRAAAFAQYMLQEEGQDSVRALGFIPRSLGEVSQ